MEKNDQKETVNKDGKCDESAEIDGGNLQERAGLNSNEEIFENFDTWMIVGKKYRKFDKNKAKFNSGGNHGEKFEGDNAKAIYGGKQFGEKIGGENAKVKSGSFLNGEKKVAEAATNPHAGKRKVCGESNFAWK